MVFHEPQTPESDIVICSTELVVCPPATMTLDFPFRLVKRLHPCDHLGVFSEPREELEKVRHLFDFLGNENWHVSNQNFSKIPNKGCM